VNHPRAVAFSLRGFEVLPAEIAAAIGEAPSVIGCKGQPLSHGQQPLAKNVISFEHRMSHEIRWSDAVDALLNSLGGAEKLKAIVETFRPEFVHVDLTLPVKESEEQEDNFITPETMARLVSLGASFGCTFV